MTAPTVTRYRVIVECLTAKTMVLSGMLATHRHGWTSITLYRGGHLPADAPADQIADYLNRGLIEEVSNG